MSNQQNEAVQKRAIFDAMSDRRKKYISKIGYDKWDPFELPKDPIDIRKDKIGMTSKLLIREFLQSHSEENYSNAYSQGAFELCLGIINEEDKFRGMFDFACWYQKKLLEHKDENK